MDDKEKKQGRRWAIIIAGVALTAAAAIVVSKAAGKLVDKAYKSSSSSGDIDFDDMGPEIVRNESAKKE